MSGVEFHPEGPQLENPTKPNDALSRRQFLNTSSAAAIAAPALSAGLMGPREAKRLRIGVVGGGFGASFPWHEHPDCEVAAVADLRADRRHKMREHFRCNNVYEEFHPMLRDSKVDAVAIWTGAPDHT